MEANDELEKITAQLRAHPDVLKVRWRVYAKAKRWDACFEIARNGEHDFWTHFWLGLILGGALGAWAGWQMFDRGWAVFLTAVGAALVAAYSAGRCGDRFWCSLIEGLCWFF